MLDAEVIKAQNEKIERYEKKLRALIQAYKSLLAEKSALEQTIRAFNSVPDHGASSVKDQSDGGIESSSPGNSLSKPGLCVSAKADLAEQNSNDDGVNEKSLNVVSEPQVAVLASDTLHEQNSPASCNKHVDDTKFLALKKAVATLMAEKAKQETAFTEDRKQLLDDKLSLERRFDDLEKNHQAALNGLRAKIEELNSNVTCLKEQRDSEMNAHSMMLKEVEQMMLKERTNKETFEAMLRSKEEELVVHTENVGKLRQRIAGLESLLKDQETVSGLKARLEKLVTANAYALDGEHRKVLESRKELETVQQKHEIVVGELERKVADLTSLLSDQEQLKRHYDAIVDSLQRQVQTDLASKETKSKAEEVSSCVDVEKLTTELQRLVRRLVLEKPELDLLGLLDLKDSKIYKTLHTRCAKKHDLLLAELEAVKAIPRNEQKDAQGCKSQLEHLTAALQDVKNKSEENQRKYSTQTAAYQAEIEQLNRVLAESRTLWEKQLAAKESEYRRRCVELENESSKQRERASRLLAEKQCEIDQLSLANRTNGGGGGGGNVNVKSSSMPGVRPPSDVVASSSSPAESAAGRSESRQSSNSVEEAFTSLTTLYAVSPGQPHNALNGSTPSDPVPSTLSPSLHYNKELLHKDLEIQKARTQLRRLENQLVAAQHELISKELLQHEIVEKLKEEIRLAESKVARLHSSIESGVNRENGGVVGVNQGSATDNLEYVKNVFVQFASCAQPVARLPMLKALCLALKMSPKETDELVKCCSKHFV